MVAEGHAPVVIFSESVRVSGRVSRRFGCSMFPWYGSGLYVSVRQTDVLSFHCECSVCKIELPFLGWLFSEHPE